MVRVEKLVNLYYQSPTVTLDMIDSITRVTIQDLKTLLDGLEDRDTSLKRPKFIPQKEIERDLKLAKEINKEKERGEKVKRLKEEMRQFEISTAEYRVWLKGYEEGYDAGRKQEWRNSLEGKTITFYDAKR